MRLCAHVYACCSYAEEMREWSALGLPVFVGNLKLIDGTTTTLTFECEVCVPCRSMVPFQLFV